MIKPQFQNPDSGFLFRLLSAVSDWDQIFWGPWRAALRWFFIREPKFINRILSYWNVLQENCIKISSLSIYFYIPNLFFDLTYFYCNYRSSEILKLSLQSCNYQKKYESLVENFSLRRHCPGLIAIHHPNQPFFSNPQFSPSISLFFFSSFLVFCFSKKKINFDFWFDDSSDLAIGRKR